MDAPTRTANERLLNAGGETVRASLAELRAALADGADPNVHLNQETGHRVLHSAAWRKKVHAVSELLAAGADANAEMQVGRQWQPSGRRYSVLSLALTNSKYDDVDGARNSFGASTGLCLALVILLLRAGATTSSPGGLPPLLTGSTSTQISGYLAEVAAAGGFGAYVADQRRRLVVIASKYFAATPLPADLIDTVVAFWGHPGEIYSPFLPSGRSWRAKLERNFRG
mmetsp:Transcript_23636/g.73020  ORF Transcript_23636/g.73020 Transcript_23636/m.73020 type:complete len:227 (+) Transcript_23636:415-1095(+)